MGFIKRRIKKNEIKMEIKNTANSLHAICHNLKKRIYEFEQFGHLEQYTIDTDRVEKELAEISAILNNTEANAKKLLNEYVKYFVPSKIVEGQNSCAYVCNNDRKAKQLSDMDNTFEFIKSRIKESFNLYNIFVNIIAAYKKKWNIQTATI